MSPSISEQTIEQYIHALRQTPFQGEIEVSEASRLVHSVDNSIYEVKPAAVLYPKNSEDVAIVTALLAKREHQGVNITAKGGGTGTNGQSLNTGIILDLSRHMNQILSFDAEKHQVTVQTGVVKDQLNAFLKPHGFFFAPELSTSNRATIGGMINTDASGQGSFTYGKTRHHVIALKGFLPNGAPIDTTQNNPLSETVANLIAPNVESMNAHFPELNRSMTGYDAKHFYEDETHNLKHLLCGAEGTLGILTEATLNVLPIPKYRTLVILSYDDFIASLRHSSYLMDAPVTPTSIEVLDDRVVERAQNDYVWEVNQHHFKGVDFDRLKAILLVEFNSDDEAELADSVAKFATYMQESQYSALLSSNVIQGEAAIKDVYGLRKRAVGLLGNIKGERRTMAFVEDCAVPPEALADFITEFKAVLDAQNLMYGMFGHVDAGVLHVRPALDLKTPEDRAMIRKVSDQVYDLCVKYKGVLWGEHGKGVRSEYCEPFFGDFYPVIRAIKSAFDPHNQMNPGKIAAPLEMTDATLKKIDATPMRGEFDALITEEMWNEYRRINFCNGNGACFNYDVHSPMCPSYKATRDRVQSPKGRAMLIKEWERRRCTDQNTPEFEEEIFKALETCLSCGSCTSECPVMINIPNARSQFMEVYYQTRKRPLVHTILAQSEERAPMLYQMRNLTNPLFKLPMTKSIMQKIGLVDATMPQDNGVSALVKSGKVTQWTIADVERLTAAQFDPEHSVIIVPDALTEYFDGHVLKDCIEVLHQLGLKVFLAPYQNSGKAYHVLGMRDQFKRSAEQQYKMLVQLSKLRVPMVGIEPPITVMYRKDYKQLFGTDTNVRLVQEFLAEYLAKAQSLPKATAATYYLMSHCMEKTSVPNAPALWQQVFTRLGLTVEVVATGCCGMSGAFGHLSAQAELSEKIYDQSWRVKIDGIDAKDHIMATGFSCRTQVERFSAVNALHPVSVLRRALA